MSTFPLQILSIRDSVCASLYRGGSSLEETKCLICAGREWSLDVDYGSATAETGAAYLAMLSIDAILGLVTSIEKLTDLATEGSPGSPGKQNGAPAWMPVKREHCTALIEVCWRTILDTLSQLLSRTSGEALIVQLLKACFRLSILGATPVIMELVAAPVEACQNPEG